MKVGWDTYWVGLRVLPCRNPWILGFKYERWKQGEMRVEDGGISEHGKILKPSGVWGFSEFKNANHEVIEENMRVRDWN